MTTPSLDANKNYQQSSTSKEEPQPSTEAHNPQTVDVTHVSSDASQSTSGQGTSPTAQTKSRSSLGRTFNAFLWSGIFIGTAAVSAIAGATVALTVPLPSFLGKSAAPSLNISDLWKSGFRYQVTRPVNILVMGIDEVPGVSESSPEIFSGRTDTLLLVRLDPQSGNVNVMSIPRDTRVQIPGYGMDKINQANVEGGPELVAQTIAYNLGNIEIDRYIRVHTGAFREMVDLVGGIEVYVPKRMEYTDQTQDLYIDLYPGWQTLDGDQAEQFARFRKDANGDIGRVQRQQMLLKAFRERLTNPTVIPKLPQAIRVLQRYVDTNLTLEEMLALANFGLEIEPDDLHMVMLPGRFSGSSEYVASYWLPDWEASAQIFQDFFQADSVAVYADNDVRYISDLRIAVQNASGEPDIGASVVNFLRDNDFNNVYLVSDWPMEIRQTEVIAQRGDLESANMVESILGVGDIVSDSTGDLNSDITIRIGEDWVEQFSNEGEDF
jgi:LCP family protein required for cell wall assembly